MPSGWEAAKSKRKKIIAPGPRMQVKSGPEFPEDMGRSTRRRTLAVRASVNSATPYAYVSIVSRDCRAVGQVPRVGLPVSLRIQQAAQQE